MSVFSNRAPRTRKSSEAYVRAVLDLAGVAEPATILGGTPTALATTVRSSPPEVLTRPEAPGKWSIAHVVHHLADAELVWGYRLRRMLTEDPVRLEGYDQDVWADRLGYGEVDAAESLELFTALRQSNLRLVSRLTPRDLDRTAIHPERGEATLGTMLRLFAGHDLLHLRQIARIRAAVGGA